MLPYWILFSLIAIGSLPTTPASGDGQKKGEVGLIFVMVLIAIMIGTRFNVGADWTGYSGMFRVANYLSFEQQLRLGDPGYQALNWMINRAGGTIWMVNLVCASIFSFGLWRLARQQPDPWISVLVAFPYLVVVVAMGYTRQGVAIGILMAGLASVSRNQSFVKFVFYVGAATAFHSTALLALPLALFGSERSRLVNVTLIVLLGVALYFMFLSNNVDRFMENYIRQRYDSQGAAIRVAMSVVPAFIFLVARKRMMFESFEYGMWRNFTVAAFIMPVGLAFLPYSTAIDRIALYILPLQIVVLARVPTLLNARILMRALLIVYCGTILGIWLNYAANSSTWIPYRSYLWE